MLIARMTMNEHRVLLMSADDHLWPLMATDEH